MKVMRWLGYFDIAVVLLAASMPAWFVLNGFNLLATTGWQLFSIANSYAVVVIVVTAAASFGRRANISSRAESGTHLKGRVAMSCLIVCVAAFLIWDARTVTGLSVDEISSPYVSYLISVLFCAGAGYALAFLVFGTYQLLGGEK